MPTLFPPKVREIMPLTKISTKHQVTIPKEVFEELRLKVGDLFEVVAEKGRVNLIPRQVVARVSAAKLSDKEQKLLRGARQKIQVIQKDLEHSAGLTLAEAEVAAKAGLISWDQRWWWTEEWQAGEREVEANIKAGRTSGPFETAEALFAHLDRQRV